MSDHMFLSTYGQLNKMKVLEDAARVTLNETHDQYARMNYMHKVKDELKLFRV